jgi:hypothetical protein
VFGDNNEIKIFGLNDPFEESVKIYGNYPSFSDYRFSQIARAMMNTGRGLKSHYILIASIDKKNKNIVYSLKYKTGWEKPISWMSYKYLDESDSLIINDIDYTEMEIGDQIILERGVIGLDRKTLDMWSNKNTQIRLDGKRMNQDIVIDSLVINTFLSKVDSIHNLIVLPK